MKIKGDLKDGNGDALTEDLELWYRDPVECIRELLNNPLFENVVAYAPCKQFVDATGKERVIDEMWTADWWNEMQAKLLRGATLAPVILSSDKTKLSQFRGDKSAWPVYLTIGNIAKKTRREVSSHATILLGYIPVGKFDCYSDKIRSAARYQFFHDCMSVILASLKTAGRTGVSMTCPDGCVRTVWPIFAAYVADYPEQCLVACCSENRCPMCQVPPTERGSHILYSRRDLRDTLHLLHAQHNPAEMLEPRIKESCTTLGVQNVCSPFWEDLPHANIFQSFTPDLLHQIHKGVFKDHLVKWCSAIIGEEELDRQFRVMTSFMGLRHFDRGISGISQWTGHEHKEMVKIFLGLVAGCDGRVVRAVHAVLDFMYLASLHSHTSS
ncbi:hypothetical protein CERSUDRAFT_55540, partial [Gelatoporia subvermispora B]